MSVYVDDMKAPLGRMIMCHMIADTRRELDEMADRIGVSRAWLQHPGEWKEHYDIARSKRALAVAAGAVEIGQLDLAKRLMARKKGTPR